ncbi:MAG TPA: hypothetical protein VGH65_11065 [Verrucomicrobiaceae bacterium]|jgi:hypothetical protein
MKLFSLILLAGAASSVIVSAAERTILFVDDEDVLVRPGTIKRVVEFKKHPGNPVIAPDKPWEGMISWNSVWRDPGTGRFQMWYQAYQERRKEDKSLKCVVCYAESEDGLKWIKPNLNLFPFYDERNSNIVLVGAGGVQGGYGDRYGNSVVVDRDTNDPDRRYKMAYYDWETGAGEKKGAGTHVAFSPDGIHWNKFEGGLVARTPFGSKGLDAPYADEDPYLELPRKNAAAARHWRIPFGMSDAMDVLFDLNHDAFVAYGKMWTPWPDGTLTWKHGMGRMESKDFIHWSKPELVLTVNDRDPPQAEFHTSPVFMHLGRYFSLNQMLDRSAGTIDAEFMSSRDGRHWDRTFANHWVIPRGAAGQFDAGSIITNGTPVTSDREIMFYYGAYRGTAVGGGGLNHQVIGSTDYFSGIGLATTPRDRFVAVGINPASPVKGQKKDQPRLTNTVGNVTLRALDLRGVKSIKLNADASKGAVRLEILSEDGYRLHGFTKEDAVPMTHDNDIAHEARWKNKNTSDLPAGRYLLRVHLDQADLFAVTLRS